MHRTPAHLSPSLQHCKDSVCSCQKISNHLGIFYIFLFDSLIWRQTAGLLAKKRELSLYGGIYVHLEETVSIVISTFIGHDTFHEGKERNTT